MKRGYRLRGRERERAERGGKRENESEIKREREGGWQLSYAQGWSIQEGVHSLGCNDFVFQEFRLKLSHSIFRPGTKFRDASLPSIKGCRAPLCGEVLQDYRRIPTLSSANHLEESQAAQCVHTRGRGGRGAHRVPEDSELGHAQPDDAAHQIAHMQPGADLHVRRHVLD